MGMNQYKRHSDRQSVLLSVRACSVIGMRKFVICHVPADLLIVAVTD